MYRRVQSKKGTTLVYVAITGLILLTLVFFVFLLVFSDPDVKFGAQVGTTDPSALPGQRIWYTLTISVALFVLISSIILLIGSI